MNIFDGQKLIKQKEFGKALGVFLKLEKKNSEDIRIFFYLGLIYFELNKYNNSILYYNKYLEKDPKSISVLHNLAILRQTIGEFDKAKETYLSILKINNLNIRAYYGLYTLDNNNLTDEMYENLIKLKKNNKSNLYEKGFINFLLSKKEKKNNNYKKELQYLKLSQEDIFNSNFSYNASSQFYYNKIISKHFNKFRIKHLKSDSLEKKERIEPIFIIGLPRSGSTLIESILTSSDQKINSFGECHVVNMSILNEIGDKIYKKDFDERSFEFEINLGNIKKNIFDRYYEYSKEIKENQKFIDKSLENFFNIEIILNIFPKAKFVHTFRNPVDSIISIYQSMLPELSWTHKIDDILIYIDNYLKIIEALKLKYPEIILDVNLENFTTNSVEDSKKIYSFCNLKWSENILDFYKRRDLYSKTLSFTQVRSKVEKYNIQKYKPYFNLLKKYKKKYNWLNID